MVLEIKFWNPAGIFLNKNHVVVKELVWRMFASLEKRDEGYNE